MKPFDLNTSLRRFDAWWQGSVIDHPPLRFSVRSAATPALPIAPEDLADRWMDADYAVGNALARLRSKPHFEDTAPIYMPNLGPDVSATLLGCELEFGANTSWSHPVIAEEEDYRRIAEASPDFGNRYWRTIETMTRTALASTRQDPILTGITDLHGAVDTLVSLRGPEDLCMDMLDCPEAVHAALERLTEVTAQTYRRSLDLLNEGGQDIATTWAAVLHDGRYYVSSADFLALISPEMAREFVRPYLRREWEELERSLFHLDGPDALRHLDWLLEEEWIQAVQWVYGAGGGRAADWLDVYRKIRAAGKSIHLLAVDARDALEVLEPLGPEGLWIEINGSEFPSEAEAEEFVAAVQARC